RVRHASSRRARHHRGHRCIRGGGFRGARRDLAVLQGLDRARSRAGDATPRAGRDVRRTRYRGRSGGRRRGRQGDRVGRRAAQRIGASSGGVVKPTSLPPVDTSPVRRWIRGALFDNLGLKFLSMVLAITVFLLVNTGKDRQISARVGVSYMLPDDKV